MLETAKCRDVSYYLVWVTKGEGSSTAIYLLICLKLTTNNNCLLVVHTSALWALGRVSGVRTDVWTGLTVSVPF